MFLSGIVSCREPGASSVTTRGTVSLHPARVAPAMWDDDDSLQGGQAFWHASRWCTRATVCGHMLCCQQAASLVTRPVQHQPTLLEQTCHCSSGLMCVQYHSPQLRCAAGRYNRQPLAHLNMFNSRSASMPSGMHVTLVRLTHKVCVSSAAREAARPPAACIELSVSTSRARILLGTLPQAPLNTVIAHIGCIYSGSHPGCTAIQPVDAHARDHSPGSAVGLPRARFG
jgi:hypothetical protein